MVCPLGPERLRFAQARADSGLLTERLARDEECARAFAISINEGAPRGIIHRAVVNFVAVYGFADSDVIEMSAARGRIWCNAITFTMGLLQH